MSVHSAYLIPIPKTRFDFDYKYTTLQNQILSSLELITSDVNVKDERNKFSKVWDSLLSNSVRDYESNRIPLSSEEYSNIIAAYNSFPLVKKTPWIQPEISKELNTHNLDFETYVYIIYSNSVLPVKNSQYANIMRSNLGSGPKDTVNFNKGPLIPRLLEAINYGMIFPVVGIGHNQFLRSLHGICYDSKFTSEITNDHIKFKYPDGSVGENVRIDRSRANVKPKPSYDNEISIGLISGRHFKTDRDIDFYLIRNSEINNIGKNFSFGEQESYAYNQSISSIRNVINNGSCLIKVYPSGLEPANIGFIRAINDLIRVERSTSLEINILIYDWKSKNYSEKLVFL